MQITSELIRQGMRELIANVSDLEVREMCIQALRTAAAQGRIRDEQFGVHDELAKGLIPMLAARKGTDLSGIRDSLNDTLNPQSASTLAHDPCLAPIYEFLVWFERAGLAWPLGALVNSPPLRVRLTRAGIRFLKQAADHPLLPGSLDRVLARCPGLPQEVISLLAQGHACIEHGLMRPAITLAGVAYESAVEAALDVLITRSVVAKMPRKAALRIAELKRVIPQLLPNAADSEARFAAEAACDFADQLRRRRNDASHTTPTYGFEDREEAEEFLVSSGRHLPHLWRLAQ